MVDVVELIQRGLTFEGRSRARFKYSVRSHLRIRLAVDWITRRVPDEKELIMVLHRGPVESRESQSILRT